MSRRPLLITIDVECDKGPDWRTRSPLAFSGVATGIGRRLHPLCERIGLRPTYLLSPEVLTDRASVALLRTLDDCELGSHLHGEYMAPGLTPAFAGARTDDMQWEYAPEVEREKLAALTELFEQQVGYAPSSFRAGRFGISSRTGAFLLELGYRCDSSITPLIQWTSQHGHKRPDFQGAQNSSWFVTADGDLLESGQSTLFEIPVTIRGTTSEPVWLRPWYSTRQQMIDLIDEVANEPDTPLCMMFHNVELIAAGSPYPQTDAEVQRFLDDIEAVMQHAMRLGFVPMTMAEAQAEALRQRDTAGPDHSILPTNPSPRPRTIGVKPEAVRAVTERTGTQGWHAYAHENRADRWDLTEPYSWLADHGDRSAPVLDVGCGIGSNLLYLAEQGLDKLHGIDVDASAIAAAAELQQAYPADIRVWVDDGLRPDAIPQQTFGAITAVNWTYLVDEFSLEKFFEQYATRLQDGGYLVLDAIDPTFGDHPFNQWLSSDWTRPVAERRPSEYKHRFGRHDISQAAAKHGMTIVQEFRRDDEIPKAVYVLQRPTRHEILFVVDAPGWAHDHKSRNLAANLPARFECRTVYQDQLTADDLDRADVVVIWYWRQLQSLSGLGEALTRNRQKLAMGVCSHNELEGELRAPGLSILRKLPARVFTHSAILEAEVRPLLPGTLPLCLPNGVDADFYLPPAQARGTSPLRVGWAGSLDNFGAEMRGVSTVIEPAIAQLQAAHPGRFELVLAAREDRMRSPEEMRAFYQTIDVYVCASRVEGTPNPALEAAACGVPVISTRVGNMPELIEHGQNGLLIDRTPRALAAALMLMEQQPQLRQRWGECIRERITESWQWRSRAAGFACMFDDILASARAAATTTELTGGVGCTH